MSQLNTIFHNDYRYEIEGSFDLSAGAAVLAITYPAGQTKTVRGRGMSVVKNGTGTYDVTVKLSSTISGPTFQSVELLDADAKLVGATVATALDARIQSVTLSTAGDIVIKVLTTQTSGAAADTTGAITVSFQVVFCYTRMDQAL
jgi:hypothetical protein